VRLLYIFEYIYVIRYLYKTKELTEFDIVFFIDLTKFKMNHVFKIKIIQL